jgi:hypothetical protein
MRGALVVILIATSLGPPACGSARSPTRPIVEGDALPVTGSERIGWSQLAGSIEEVSALRFRLTVDGTIVELPGVSCVPAGSGRFDCSAPLPRMSPGRHLLSLRAIDSQGVEGPPSATLVVFVSSS